MDEYVPGTIYIVEYPIRFGGMDLYSRRTLVRLGDGKLWLPAFKRRWIAAARTQMRFVDGPPSRTEKGVLTTRNPEVVGGTSC